MILITSFGEMILITSFGEMILITTLGEMIDNIIWRNDSDNITPNLNERFR